MTPELIALIVVASTSVVSCAVLAYVLVQKQTRQSVLLIDNNKHTVEQALKMLKAQNLEKVIEADAKKQSYDIQLQNLQDTIAENAYDEREIEKVHTPVKARTADGREIDLRDYELF